MNENFKKDVSDAFLDVKHKSLAQDAVLCVILRNWGATAAEVMTHLDEAAERIEADALANSVPDSSIETMRQTFGPLRYALNARLHERP